MNGQTYVFYRLYTSRANYIDGTPVPLPYCRIHKLHENPMPNTANYCPWVDYIRGPKLRRLEEEVADRESQRRLIKMGSKSPKSILAKMGL
jgi:hypothetical protein